ncbi:MAG: deoxyhypusine synthase family protein [Nanoarchaeota archaeon]|nr:deoxyhypusine synthase family protein [Nanoarchaeota archaeon]
MKEIKHIKVEKEMKVVDLVEQMGEIGFTANKINKASRVLKKMIDDKECTVFFGLAGAMVPGGMKQIILDILDRVDVFVTTGANMTHDLIEALGHHHYHHCGEHFDDEELNEKGLDRIYNVLMKNEVYEDMEKFFEGNWEEINKTKTIKEFLWKLGELLDKDDCILTKCWKKKIPIFCPAIADSGIGLMILGKKSKSSEEKFDLPTFEDMKEIIDIAWTAKKSGVLYVNGGFSKNFIQQSLQFSKGAEYGVQISTATPYDGGSSGAPLAEGISWGKMNKESDFVDVICDATVVLPLIIGSVL